MEKTTTKESAPGRGKKKELHCPECGSVVAKAGRGTNAVFRCPRCKKDVDLNYTGETLIMNMYYKEA